MRFQPRFPGVKPPRLNRNQYGANLGGPVWRNKTFFFFNWESGRQIAGSFGGQALIPPAALRSGDFSGVTAMIRDPADRAAVPRQPNSDEPHSSLRVEVPVAVRSAAERE